MAAASMPQGFEPRGQSTQGLSPTRFLGVEDVTFEGGGAKGLAFGPAMGAIDWTTVRRVRGSSAGAIAAALAAAGYSGAEVVELLDGETLLSFFDRGDDFTAGELEEGTLAGILLELDLPWIPEVIEGGIDRALLAALARTGRGRKLLGLTERCGLYKGDALLAWMRARLAEAYQYEPTFAGLERATGVELEIVVSDVTAGRPLYLGPRSTPELGVAEAVRMSMGFPAVWEPVAWREEWGGYCPDGGTDGGQSTQGLSPAAPEDLAGHLMVDGGLLDNFAICRARGEWIGFLIDEDAAVVGQEGAAAGAGGRVEDFRLAGYLTAVASAAVQNGYRAAMAAADPKRVCRLPAKGYGTLEFDLSGKRRRDLLEAADRAARATLEGLYGR